MKSSSCRQAQQPPTSGFDVLQFPRSRHCLLLAALGVAAAGLAAPGCTAYYGCEKTRTCPGGGQAGDSPEGGDLSTGKGGTNPGFAGSLGAGGEQPDGPAASSECAEVDCQENATCALELDSPVCKCNSGFEEWGDTCRDIDECGDGACGANQVCENEPGAFTCACAPGFYEDHGQCWSEMVLVSASSENQGLQTMIGGARLSAGGHHVAFGAASVTALFPSAGAWEVLRWERGGGLSLALPSGSGAGISAVSLSEDGSVVAVSSNVSTFVSGDTNDAQDVFLISAGKLQRASVSSSGIQGNGMSVSPSLSADGKVIAFASMANNLVPDDTNDAQDIFVRDLATGSTVRASLPVDTGAVTDCTNPHTSGRGRFVAFPCSGRLTASDTNDDVDVYLWDREAQLVELVSRSPTSGLALGGGGASISGDGRFVVFSSGSGDFVSGDSNAEQDAFILDRVTGQFELLSVSSADQPGNAASHVVFGARGVSDDGRYAVFDSDATNLVPGDTNGSRDVFLRDRVAGTTTIVSTGPDGQVGDASATTGEIASNGRFLVFYSRATNFGGKSNGVFTELWLKRIVP